MVHEESTVSDPGHGVTEGILSFTLFYWLLNPTVALAALRDDERTKLNLGQRGRKGTSYYETPGGTQQFHKGYCRSPRWYSKEYTSYYEG